MNETPRPNPPHALVHDVSNHLQIVGSHLEMLRLRLAHDAHAIKRIDAGLGALDQALSLLRRSVTAERGLPAIPITSQISARRLRVVLAEDDPLVRMAISALLADMGHSVSEAANGAAALVALAGGADLLITDLGLPDMNGDDLAGAAIAHQPTLAVVVATGSLQESPSPYTWLSKPFNEAKLRQAIAAAVRG